MSDPVIKGAKRNTSRPAPSSASSKSSAKRKVSVKSARPQPKPKRSAAEKAPVRKATPKKSAPAAKASRPAPKQSKSAAKPKSVAAKARPAAAAPGKKKAPAPVKASAKKSAPAKTVPASKSKAATPPKPAQRPAPAPPRQPSRDEAAALKAFERAHKEFARGRFVEARNLFRALIEQHAGVSEVTARARTYLAIADTRMRSEAALPRDAESLYDRGVIELNRGEYVAAQEMFERAIKREPSSADAHYALAATRARLGSVELALQALERAVELKPLLRVRAQHDIDLAMLRSEPDFERIVYSSARA
jgi:tetratricopeptide (TPR) repeat protein